MARNDPVEIRLDKMAEWAATINEHITDLTNAMVVSTEEHADSISLQLAEMLGARQANHTDYLTALDKKAQLSIDSALDDQIAVIEAEIAIEVSCALDDDGKKLYGNPETRKAASTIALNANEQYKALIAKKREQRRELAQARAVLEHLDREASEYKRATDNLVARLNNLTARVGMRRKEN